MQELEALKKANLKINYTAVQLDELARCREDPIYFCKNFVMIQHQKLGCVPFEPYKFQLEIINGFHTHKNTIILAGRQCGKTTCAAGYLLWHAMFNPDKCILICANKLSQAHEIMGRVRYAYENCPNYIRAGVKEYNKGNIAFDNGSSIVSRATTGDSGRGLTVGLLYVDEFAFVPPRLAQEFWTSIQPTLSTGGSCIITSTPKNDEDQFSQIWKGAIDTTDEYGNPREDGLGKNAFFGLSFPWWHHPDRDEAWAKPYRESLGEARFQQEFCCSFVSDDLTLINPMTLVRLSKSDPIGYTGTVRWYRDPEPNRGYLIGLDPSVGNGNDYAAIQVFQLPEMMQVAEWHHNNTDTRGQIRTLLSTLKFLDDYLRADPEQMGDPEIYWTVENNSIGEAALVVIEDTGEERFPGMFVSEKKRRGTVRRIRKGMNTTNRSKLSACARLKSLIESDRMVINSGSLLRELKNYVSSGASFKAKPGEHDDLVSALLLVVRMLDVALQWGANAGDLREVIRDEELDYEDDAMPML